MHYYCHDNAQAMEARLSTAIKQRKKAAKKQKNLNILNAGGDGLESMETVARLKEREAALLDAVNSVYIIWCSSIYLSYLSSFN